MKINKIIFLISALFLLGACSNAVQENKAISNQQTKIKNNIVVNDDSSTMSDKVVSKLENIPLGEFKVELAKKDYNLIDLRTNQEIKETGVISGAKQIDFYDKDFAQTLNSLNKDEKYLIYCRSGGRSSQTLKLMKEMGFTNVLELRGGMNNWLKVGEKTVKLNSENESMIDEVNESIIDKKNSSMMSEDKDSIMDSKDVVGMMPNIVTLNATKWQFDKKIIRAKKGEKLIIKVNNIDGLHGIVIPEMKLLDDNQIEVDTSKAGTYEFRCLNYCGKGHSTMTGTLIIE